MNRALRKEEGFTLVEIIVVIVIMAILAAIAVPSVLGYINDANDAKYIAEARSIYLACQVEEAKYNGSNTIGTSTDYMYADLGNAVEENVIKRFTTDPSGTVVKSIDYVPAVTTEGSEADAYYQITFTPSSGGTDKIATVTANDEVTIA